MVIEAIYENGVFRPTGAVDVPEGTRVSVDLPDASEDAGSHPWLEFAGAWSEETADEVERIIEETCEQIHPGDYPENVL